MTVLQAIIKWLKTFSPENMKYIDTDVMHADVDYALTKEPTKNVKKFISGTEIHTEHYQIRARLPSQTNTECIENNEWLESLTKWIEKNNKEKNFPELLDTVQEVGISSSFYLGTTDTSEALYQMTIYIKYMRKGET